MFTKEDKKNTSRVFFGILMYAFMVQVLSFVVTIAVMELQGIIPWAVIDGEPDQGLVMLCSVCIGALCMWGYFSHMQRKYGLFDLKGFVRYVGPGEPEEAIPADVPDEANSEQASGIHGETQSITSCIEDKLPDAADACAGADGTAGAAPEKLRPAGRILHFRNLKESTFRKGMHTTARILFVGLCFALCCQIVNWGLTTVMEAVFNSFGRTIHLDTDSFNVSLSVPMSLYIAFIGPFIEELIYRGFLMNGLKPYGKVFAIVVSSLFFALMHGNLDQLFFAFLCGILLGYVASEYSIIASTIVHIINNGGLSYAAMAFESVVADPVQTIVECMFAAVGTVILLVLIVKHRKSIAEFLRFNTTKPGAYKRLLSVWAVLFILLHAAEIALMIKPL